METLPQGVFESGGTFSPDAGTVFETKYPTLTLYNNKEQLIKEYDVTPLFITENEFNTWLDIIIFAMKSNNFGHSVVFDVTHNAFISAKIAEAHGYADMTDIIVYEMLKNETQKAAENRFLVKYGVITYKDICSCTFQKLTSLSISEVITSFKKQMSHIVFPEQLSIKIDGKFVSFNECNRQPVYNVALIALSEAIIEQIPSVVEPAIMRRPLTVSKKYHSHAGYKSHPINTVHKK